MSIGMTESQPRNGGDKFNLTTPAGWAMLYFVASIVILSILFLGA